MKAMTGLFLAMAGLGLGATEASAQAPVSFSQEVMPILRTQCAGCHLTGDEPGGMKLYPSAAHQSLVGVSSAGSPLQRVAAGNPDESYLLHKLQGTHLDVGGEGVRMPFAQAPLPEESLRLIRRWIQEGAQNN